MHTNHFDLHNIPRPKPHSELPAHAKKVFHGEIFDTYQWEQRLYDGRTATFERLQRSDTVEVVGVLPDQSILLIKQEQPGTQEYLSLVAGRMEEGEKPFETIKRELREETGYEAQDWIFWSAYQPVHKIDWAVYTFVAKGLTKVTDVQLDGGEKITTYPVSFEEFLRLAPRHQLVSGVPLAEICEAALDQEKNAKLRDLLRA
jgi:8-oxo-dGTP pyrophosphatase MutT (NUDIX family)